MENTENTSQAMHLLAEAHRAWERMRPLREKRERNKNFTYGNQWCDMMTDEHGRRVSEWQHLRDNASWSRAWLGGSAAVLPPNPHLRSLCTATLSASSTAV